MIHDLPTQFGAEGENPIVTRVEFTHSGVSVEGQFRPNEFATLEKGSLEFLRLYLKVRGNLKEVERVLGLSYPTVRARFETLLKALGLESIPEVPAPEGSKEATLSALERGELSVEDVLARLEGS